MSNEPVVFSTWGYDYAPPINHEDITNKIPNISEVSKTTTDVAMQNGNLTAEESKDALSMIKTIKFVKTHPGHIVPTIDELNQL